VRVAGLNVFWRGSVIAAVALGLSSCFASLQPLITASNAATPLSAGVVTEYFNCDSDAGRLVGCTGYQSRSTAKLSVKDGVYTVHPDPNPALAKVFPGGQVNDLSFRLGRVSGDLYVLQLPFGDTDASSTSPQFVYELARLQGQTLFLYEFSCEQNGDKTYVRSGDLAKISDVLMVPTCEASSLDGLGKVFADRVANGAGPDEKFVVAPAS
jgi:hypothetical protein